MAEIDVAGWQVGPPFCGEDDHESLLLDEMGREAEQYLRRFHWAPPISSMHLAYGVGSVIALFLVRFAHPVADNDDDKLWVVVGDLPSAYFVIDNALTARDALDVYCELMSDWSEAVMNSASLHDVFPVDATPSIANAEALTSRIGSLRTMILPCL